MVSYHMTLKLSKYTWPRLKRCGIIWRDDSKTSIMEDELSCKQRKCGVGKHNLSTPIRFPQNLKLSYITHSPSTTSSLRIYQFVCHGNYCVGKLCSTWFTGCRDPRRDENVFRGCSLLKVRFKWWCARVWSFGKESEERKLNWLDAIM